MKRSKNIFSALLVVCGLPLAAQPPGISPTPPTPEKKILSNNHIREADVFWEKRIWRIIDLREKLNLPFSYPQKNFVSILLDAIESGEITAYNALDDNFTKPLPWVDIDRALNIIDSAWVPDPENPDREILVRFKEMFNPLSVKKIRVQEVWFFDEATSTMMVRVMGLAPVRDVVDRYTDEIRGESDIFWVYYPDIRDVLVRHLAFNPYNDAVRFTWDDIFQMRLFSSYIVKESNVYDREIQNYSTGIDAVLESERIKYELFRKEHEMWEY